MQFVDEKCGEWYGYLHRDGSLNLDFKGGPFKGEATYTMFMHCWYSIYS